MQLSATIRRSPFLKFLLFYMSGIITPVLVGDHFNLLVLFILVTIIFAVLIITCSRPSYHTGIISGVLVALLLFVTGISGTLVRFRLSETISRNELYNGTLIMQIKEPVAITGRSLRTTACLKYVFEKGSPVKTRQHLLVSIEYDSNAARLEPGTRLICHARLSNITGPSNPDEFNYKKYMAARGIYNQVYIPTGKWKQISSGSFSPEAVSFRMQKRLLDQYHKIGLDPALYGLLSAITLGYKSDLEARTKQIFAGAGVMHIMALSGYNVAVIAFAVGYLLFFTSRSRAGRFLKTVLIIATIWLFAFITGLSPSVTRAAVMISLVLAGSMLNRTISTGNILFISAFILLALSPMLIADVSFQLSFAAVLGIVTLEPPLSSLFSFRSKIVNKVWQLFTVSCAAQLATLPLTLYYFHQFPVYFWITNLYVVPLVSVIICVAGVFLICSFWHPLMMITGKALAILLSILYKSVSVAALLPGALIENIYMSPAEALILVLIITSVSLFFITGYRLLVFASLSLLFAFILISTFHQYKINRQQMVMVGNIRGSSVIHVITGKKAVVVCDDAGRLNESLVKYHFGNFRVKSGIAKDIRMADTTSEYGYRASWLGHSRLFINGEAKVMVLYDDTVLNCLPGFRLHPDLLVITNSVSADMDKLLMAVNPERIVIDSSVRPSKRKYWKRACAGSHIKCHVVNDDGYYLLSAN